MTMRVGELWRFPVKSMQGESVERLTLAADGAVGDRLWGVIDVAAGKVLSAKRTAALLDARAALDDATGEVTITLPDGTALLAGEPATDEAISAWLGKEVRVQGRPADPVPYELTMDPTDDASEVWDFATPPGSFVDLAATHLLTSASVAAAAAAHPDGLWSVHRFRPTAFIDAGDVEGFVEDEWVGGDVRLGGATCSPFMPTPRCRDADPRPGPARSGPGHGHLASVDRRAPKRPGRVLLGAGARPGRRRRRGRGALSRQRAS